MIYRKKISFYKTNEPVHDLFNGMRVEGKYVVDYFGELWNGKSITSDGRKDFHIEGESLLYIIKDKEFLNSDIEPEFEDDIFIGEFHEDVINFFKKVRKQEILELKQSKNRRRWLNQMEIDHD